MATERNDSLAMAVQVQHLKKSFDEGDAWNGLLKAYPELRGAASAISKSNNLPVPIVADELVQMYKRYVGEWDSMAPVLFDELPARMTAGASAKWVPRSMGQVQ